MVSKKRFNSVAHNIAYHSISGVSQLHPILGKACAKASIEAINVNLIHNRPNPKDINLSPLLLSRLSRVKRKLKKIFEADGFQSDDLINANLTFYFTHIHEFPLGKNRNAPAYYRVNADGNPETSDVYLDFESMKPSDLPKWEQSTYCYYCHSHIVDLDGKTHEEWLNHWGCSTFKQKRGHKNRRVFKVDPGLASISAPTIYVPDMPDLDKRNRIAKIIIGIALGIAALVYLIRWLH